MSAKRPILIVEDDDAFRQVLVDQIAAIGIFQATEAATLDEASRHFCMPAARFDLILLDIGLPDGDGRDFCAKLRKQGHTMPIIMLTAAIMEDDVIGGLNAGANDYIAKPFRINELMARLVTQLRLFDASGNAVLTIGPYAFHPAAKALFRADKKQRIRLTTKEVGILKCLYLHAGRGVSRQMLLDAAWRHKAFGTTPTLESHIYRLRQKLETDPKDHRLLITEAGGYRLDTASA
jgi:DNA-binding response OmpR family regulator